MIINEKLLRDMGACEEGIQNFLEVFKDGEMDASNQNDMLKVLKNTRLVRDACWFLSQNATYYVDLDHFTFKNMEIDYLNLGSADILYATFKNCVLNRAHIDIHNIVVSLKFKDTTFNKCFFLDNSSFAECEFDNVKFVDCKFCNTEFYDCKFNNIKEPLPKAKYLMCEVDGKPYDNNLMRSE